MSLPEFPTINPPLTREDAINQIISSIAMEELAISHIINAEGEKLQYVLGTIPGLTGPAPTIQEILDINESVRSVLQSAADSQTALRNKLQNALSASTMRGPTGPTGPTGPAGIAIASAQVANYDGAGVETTILADANIPFTLLQNTANTDITYAAATQTFTINNSLAYDFYYIQWRADIAGYEGIPFSISLMADGLAHTVIGSSEPEGLVHGMALVLTNGAAVEISLANTSGESFTLAADLNSVQISFLGFNNPA